MTDLSERLNQLTPLQRATLALKEMRARLDAAMRKSKEPIAIIGIGCRLPGGAEDPASYWRLLRGGFDAVREVPAERWDASAYYDPEPMTPGKASTKRGGFLDQVSGFDASFFGITPREAMSMDPQQRLMLEVAWEALEDAGIAPDRLSGSATGVFLGVYNNDYARFELRNPSAVSLYSGTGNGHCFIAGRVSFVLGLQGRAWPWIPPAPRRSWPSTRRVRACAQATAIWRSRVA